MKVFSGNLLSHFHTRFVLSEPELRESVIVKGLPAVSQTTGHTHFTTRHAHFSTQQPEALSYPSSVPNPKPNPNPNLNSDPSREDGCAVHTLCKYVMSFMGFFTFTSLNFSLIKYL